MACLPLLKIFLLNAFAKEIDRLQNPDREDNEKAKIMNIHTWLEFIEKRNGATRDAKETNIGFNSQLYFKQVELFKFICG